MAQAEVEADRHERIVSCRIGPYPRPLPQGMFDPRPQVVVVTETGRELTLFQFYPDELHFSEYEFIGKTVAEGRRLFFEKDRAYLQS